MNYKHVGRTINTDRRCVVVFREVPDEPEYCLIVDTDALTDWMHDDVINAVQSPGAQATGNFYEYCQRTMFTDGSNMLQRMHSSGLLRKQKTENIAMLPNNSTTINLAELNSIIREQNGGEPAVSAPVDENVMPMAVNNQANAVDQANAYLNPTTESEVVTESAPAPAPAPVAEAVPAAPVTAENGVLDDAAIAKGMISQAEAYEEEARQLKEQAYEMDPGLKPRRGRPAKQPAE
jgi:hypothetical protein